MKKTIIVVAASLALAYGNMIMAQDEVPDDATLERGKEAFEICSACHGEQGEGNEDLEAPKLSGQYDWYLITQLKNFRAEIRGVHDDDENGQLMQPMAEDMEDQEIEDVVTYIMTLDPNFVPEDD